MSLDIENTCDYCLRPKTSEVYRIMFEATLMRSVVKLRMCNHHRKECFVPTDYADELSARLALVEKLLCNQY